MIKLSNVFVTLNVLILCASCQSSEQKQQNKDHDFDWYLNFVPKYVNFEAANNKPDQVYFLNITGCPYNLDKFKNLKILAFNRCTIDGENASELSQTQNLKEFIALGCNIEQLSFSEAQRKSIDFVKIAFCELSDINSLNAELLTLNNLNRLVLSMGAYPHFPKELSNLSNLQDLAIGNVSVDNFNFTESFENMAHLSSLNSLNISSSDISELPQNINKLKFLKQFGFYKCPGINVTDLLEETVTWPELETLKLSGHNLVLLPENIIQHKSLKEIILAKNNELKLPETFETLSKIPTLESLDISYNVKTEDFDSTLLNNLPMLKNLKKLNMSGNTLFTGEYYWGILSQLQNLEEIIMYSTSGRLHPDINKLKKLKMLEISETGSKMFDEVSSLPAQIEEIICAESFLDEFPTALLSSTALKSLSLFHNEIPQIPEEISQLKKLEHLNLAHNELKELPESIKELKNLKYLNLMGNPLDNYPEKRKQIEEWLPNTIIFWGI